MADKTAIIATFGATSQTNLDYNIRYCIGSASLITFYTEDSGTLADSLMVDTTVVIEVY